MEPTYLLVKFCYQSVDIQLAQATMAGGAGGGGPTRISYFKSANKESRD